MSVCLITGITGQDGSYLAEYLISKGHTVYGMERRTSTMSNQRISHLDHNGLETYYGDLADANSIVRLLMQLKPDEIYNMGAMSHVRISFDIPEYTAQVTGIAPLRILEALRTLGAVKTKYYQASSSEMFGLSAPPQDENTTMLPVSPYGCAKLYAYHITRAYRLGYSMFACNGILFNHESPRRGENFVTKKIIRAATRIKLGNQRYIILGNLDAKRDWGFAGDYVKAIYQIMQAPKADDWVVATGEHYSVREFAEEVFKQCGLDFYDHLHTSSEYYRPNEVPDLCGNPAKIREKLLWQHDVGFKDLIKMMLDSAWDEEVNHTKYQA